LEATQDLIRNVGTDDLRDHNVIRLDKQSINPVDLTASVSAVPFLSERRLVIVNEFFSKTKGKKQVKGWENLSQIVKNIPPTNDLLFRESQDSFKSNSLFKQIAELASVREFAMPHGSAINKWIQERVNDKGGDIDNKAISRLAHVIGPNTWALDAEIEKLILYANDRQISSSDIDLLTTDNHQDNIFRAVDMALNGNPHAMASVKTILNGSESPGYILAMIHRQVRLLITAKMSHGEQISRNDLSKQLNLRGYAMDKLLEEVRRHNLSKLMAAHSLLAETDEKIKTGKLTDMLALEMLLGELALLNN
jgi:DNA polymerase-3 subunit delta|tara:strand:- start:153 stop:1076 length:924 start_codon:yes stop_codon:yes gene_type:complete